jgi:3'(2'), 5'-bisphosphate nucleotidase
MMLTILFNLKDHACGAIIVSEAGGIVTDIRGQPLDFSVGRKLIKNRGILACPKSIHARVIDAAQHVTKL